MKLINAVEVPNMAANLLVPRAACGGIPARSREGIRTNPPPPATLSMNPARKDMRESNRMTMGSMRGGISSNTRFRDGWVFSYNPSAILVHDHDSLYEICLSRRSRTCFASATIRSMTSFTVGSSWRRPVTCPTGRIPFSMSPSSVARRNASNPLAM